MSESDCDVFRPAVFIAPTEGCGSALTCSAAVELDGTGTYNIPNIATGNGCHTCISAEHAYWYTFTPTCDGTVTIASCDMGEDTNFYLYSATDGCQTLQSVAASDDDCTMGPGLNGWASRVENIPVTSGTTYYIEWDNKWTNAGFDWEFTLTQPNVLYVASDASGSDQSGCDWSNAITNLSVALDKVAQDANYDELWVKSGTYYPEDSQGSGFILDGTINLFGGFDGSESTLEQRDPSTNFTILSGDIGIPDDNSDNCENVVTIGEANPEVLIDGVIIERGSATAAQSPTAGGGLLCYGSADIRNTIIRECTSTDDGSAIYVAPGTTTLVLDNVTLTGNTAANNGASVEIGQGSTLQVNGVTSLD